MSLFMDKPPRALMVEALDAVRQALFDALYQPDQLKLEYDAAMTRNAAQAFAVRSGNCLSLVIMTAAFAKEMGLDVRYQNVFGEDVMRHVEFATKRDASFAATPLPTSHRESVCDPIRVTHLGQRSCDRTTQAGHMAATDQSHRRCQHLARRGPSTYGFPLSQA